MTINEINKMKRIAVAKAWNEEKIKISEKEAQRNWSEEEQEKLLCLNQIYGYVCQPLCSNYYDNMNSTDYIQFLDFECEFIPAHANANRNIFYGLYDFNEGKVYQNTKIRRIKIASVYQGYNDKRKVLKGQADEYGVIIGNGKKRTSKKVNTYGVEKKHK